MIIAAEKMSNEQRYEFISKFGIGQDNGLGLPGEADGLLYSADQWDLRTQNTVLFGQAYTTNALQLTNAVAVIANKGVKKPQRIIKAISDAEGHSEEQKPEGEATRVIDEQVASQVMNAMDSVSRQSPVPRKLPVRTDVCRRLSAIILRLFLRIILVSSLRWC